MSSDRPTFSELWYRVADMRPRLRTVVQLHRQHFRGELWYVVQDATSNQFFRLHPAAYELVARLDGRRTVAEAWRICMDELGDDAMTQGEVIQLLGRLYTANLLQADVPPDAEGLFRRYRKRRQREVGGAVASLLFVRIPLLDPDRFLERWVGVLGRLFTWYGVVFWVACISAGVYFALGRVEDLGNSASAVLDPANLPLLYLSLILIKICHEFGHAVACKKFGRQEGERGEVHVMGIMLLVFMPLPFVDASSAWALRRKRHRILIGAAGMLVELGLAGIAAVVWANTAQGSTVHAIAYNAMFVASVSTVLFNGNPLLRYDAYYILSDLLEIPNLAPRARDYVHYLVKRYVWGVRHARTPVEARGEQVWSVAYFAAASVFRVFVCVGILLFVADKWFFVGAVLALTAIVGWVAVPLVRFGEYLASNQELARVRRRAVLTSAAAVMLVALAPALLVLPDRCRVEGVVEPRELSIIHADVDGFIQAYLPSGTRTGPDGDPVVEASSMAQSARLEVLLGEREVLAARKRLARRADDTATCQITADEIDALGRQIDQARRRLSELVVRAPFSGTWIAPHIDRSLGAFARRGERLGMVAGLDALIVRAPAGQETAARIIAAARPTVEFRVKGRPGMKLAGTIETIRPAGGKQLPSKALGYSSGGSIRTVGDGAGGDEAAERVFEVLIVPDAVSGARLLSGQRVVVRFEVGRKRLLTQWWQAARRLVQRRFRI